MTLKHSSDKVAGHRVPGIGFVWRPEDLTPALLQMAERTGSRAVFDLSTMGSDGLASFLAKVDPLGQVRDIKVSLPTFLDPALGRVLQKTGVSGIWVECHPHSFPGDPATWIRRLGELSQLCTCFPVIGDTAILDAILKHAPGLGTMVLKGCEASGFVSGETTTALYAMVKEMLRTASESPDLLIWGGVSTPEAAAAFLSTGATGVVFESIHWLTDLVAIDDLQRQRLSKLRLDATDLVGLDLQAPCRLFNKGNSQAFKEIKALEDSLSGARPREQARRFFAGQLQAGALHPLRSHFGPDEVVALGVEAAFAASFLERFGAATEKAVTAFLDEIRKACRLNAAKKDCFLESPVAREMGTFYPFIQGAMSWITDVPEFAARVADAGGLPTIALGLMDAETLERRLGRLPEIMGGRSYAVNVISLAENPFRETHLAWIMKQRPRFVVIAGGDLSSLRQLMACGIEVIYIAPDEALLRLALEAGVRYLVCEGYEAGGHVGQHSTLTLAQMVLDLKRRAPALFQNARLVLAGGIYNRETAFMAALLGAEAIQMGTAYLATREIVATGALTELYQRMILNAPPGGTVVSGRDTGLRVRSLRTPRTEAIVTLEKEFAAGQKDEASFRSTMETIAAGSLFAAARGLERPGGVPLDEKACLERGQFMSGACAGLTRTVQTLHSLHRELAQGPLVRHHTFEGEIMPSLEPAPGAPPDRETPSPGQGSGQRRVALRRDAPERVAITGMSILNALGQSPEQVWEQSLALKCGVTPVPPSRWDHGLFYDPRPRVSDKTYCQVGAFLDFRISRTELGIPPQDFRSMTEATKITMWLADRAIRASGILESDIPRERIGVLISQNSGESAGTLPNIIIRSYLHDILAAVNRAVPLTPDQARAIEKEVKAGRMAPDDTTLLGRLNCAAPGFICNRYGFTGPSYAVSAACATSLVALHSALQMIQNGIIDAAVVGGGEERLTHLHFLEFSALGALYGLSGQLRPAHETSRPFDAARDGLVLGEGGGMIVIERESLARARGARLHAVITGMGASNSHMGMVESASVAQESAIRASFRDLPYGPDAVDLVECHATSTRQGDVAEVQALKTFFSPSKRTVLTSFKSQIGHTLGASGINNLIRGTMALKTGVFPATLNYEHPDPEMGLDGSGLLIAPEPFDWKGREGEPRRLQVNAFGFGGSNYVVQVEQARDEADTILVSPGRAPGPERGEDGAPGIEIGEGGAPTLQGVSFFRTELDGRNCRMAVVADSHVQALSVIESAAGLGAAGKDSAKLGAAGKDSAERGAAFLDSARALRSLAQQGIFLGREDLPVPPLALVFPGQGSQYAGMGRELYDSFPVIRKWMDRAATAADFDLLDLLFHDKEKNLQKTRWQQPALFALEHAMARYLTSLGIRPVAMAGHSLGELTALCLAGVFTAEDGFRIVNMRAICMDKAAAMHVEPGIMAAVDAPLDLLQEMIQGREHVYIGNINSPRQVVICGHSEAVKHLSGSLKEMGYRATLLRVSMAFHSPIMTVIHAELEAYLASITLHPPRIPVISNTTMAPYPSDPDAIRRILMAHLESPVHWMNNVQTLWNDYGVRLFVEVGPGEPLSNLIADTLADPACIQTCLPQAEGHTLRTALAQLFVQGHLKLAGEPEPVSLPAGRQAPESPRIAPALALPYCEPGSAGSRPVERVIQGEINRFVLESFGRFLKPNILEALRRELNPELQEGDLPDLIETMLAGSEPPEIRPQAAAGKLAVPPREPTRPLPEPAPTLGGQAPTLGEPALSFPEPAPPLLKQGGTAGAEASHGQDLMERLIRIIMEATGFERDEIRPEMDLRKDLSIRSSRLPIIMDAAERQFGITIELEEFIDARTVQDIARRIASLSARHGAAGLPRDSEQAEPAPAGTKQEPAPPGEASHAPAGTGQEQACSGEATHGQDLMERLIRIIMEATGFERDEINPAMDLRKDLSIRSSRLPIIMDAAERQFGITIEMEDFIDARTVQDIARRISAIVDRREGARPQPDGNAVAPAPARDEIPNSPRNEASLKRLVFKEAPVAWTGSIPIALSPGDAVILLSPDQDDGMAKRAGEILSLDHGVAAFPMPYRQGDSCPVAAGHDLLTDAGSRGAAEGISGLASLAGMIVTLPQDGPGWGRGMADIAQLLRGFVLPLQAFLKAPGKKFVVLIHSRESADSRGRLLAEGLLGLFLSAAQEHASVQFRSLEIERDTDLRAALRGALDKGCPVVELRHREGGVFTSQGQVTPSVFGAASGVALHPGDVIVMSGGATGISAHLALSLVPFLPRLVLLGRTSLEAGLDPERSRPGQTPFEACAVDRRASEIARTLADLRSLGIEASYHACDVTDPDAVRAVLGEVISRHGRIDGIIHGAGVLRDGLLSQMTPDDFSQVTDVKFLGAWHLFSAAQGAGLRFFVGLSSAAAIQGNPGQANYAAANRIMSALLRTLHRENSAIRCQALMLPPVEGGGMAENPELRELLKLKGVAYIHVNELAGLFCRELLATRGDDDWVMFMRELPPVRGVLLDDTRRPSPGGELDGGTVSLNGGDFPMIEGISRLDIRREELEACRSFSREKDLWLADHRPFRFVEHPLVSAAMILETFMEAARILYPHLKVRGVRQVRLMDMIQCPPGVPRPATLSCRRLGDGREVVCEVSLAATNLSPAGRLTDRCTAHCQGQVILAGGGGCLGAGPPDFPVRLDELRTGPMDHEKVLQWYRERSGLAGRYRVMEVLDGAGPGVVRGRTTYRQTDDFANPRDARYQYSPYLLEALLQLVGFHGAATDPSERRSMIPLEIGEMRFLRPCRAEERILLEARMRVKDEEGVTFDARGVDEEGRAIMQVHNLRMHWVSG